MNQIWIDKQQKTTKNKQIRNKHLYFITFILGMLSFWIVLYIGIIGGSIYGNILVLWIVRTTRSLQNVNNLLVANLAGTGQLFSERVSVQKFDIAIRTD